MKRKISILLLCFVPYIMPAESWLITSIRNGDWDTIDRTINTSHTQGFQERLLIYLFKCNKEELRIVRNALYARHGCRFNSPDLQELFDQFAWYNGTKENVIAELSDDEKNYIRIISRIEINYPAADIEELIGFWMEEDYLNYLTIDGDSGWNYLGGREHLRIYANGTFYYQDSYRRFLFQGIYGLWSFNNNVFTITPLSNNEIIFGDLNILINNINRNIRFSEYSHDGISYISCNLFNDGTRWVKLTNEPSGHMK